MKLYDIRNALKNLVNINKDLTKDRLTTLLQAAGWNVEDIKDAVLMWETNSYEGYDVSSVTNDSTGLVIKEESLPTTGLLDNATTIFAETSLVKETQIKKEEEINKVEEVIKENTKTILSTPEKDIVSELKETKTETQVEIKEKIETKETPPSVFDYVSKETPHDELPHNLPLRPYESSFVTVPLNEYEKRFASHVSSRVDTMETHKEIIKEQSQSQTQNKTEIQSTPPTLNQSQRPIYVNKVVEAPLEMEDKYLAFIAIVLFILIMFILGYMHINGRI